VDLNQSSSLRLATVTGQGCNTTGWLPIAFTRPQDNRIHLKTSSKTFGPQICLFWNISTYWQDQMYKMVTENLGRIVFGNLCSYMF
jgi:hypothetical protein